MHKSSSNGEDIEVQSPYHGYEVDVDDCGTCVIRVWKKLERFRILKRKHIKFNIKQSE